MNSTRLLIIGNPQLEHVGSHLYRAARALGIEALISDSTRAYEAPRLMRAAYWRLGRRTVRLESYGKELLDECSRFRPSVVLSTGIAPLSRRSLIELQKLGVPLYNFLTDDPWNPNHYAPWFLQTLPYYTRVFSPRRANLEDLRRVGVKQVAFLRFAYAPEVHFVPAVPEVKENPDVIFVGGADRDRLPFVMALLQAGFRLQLYGNYWDRNRQTRDAACGICDPATVGRATREAKIALCLVRRANRDGHCMRTFEIPAVRGCMLAEETDDHREIFGPEGETVMYFRDTREMLRKARWLVEHFDERERLASAAHHLVTTAGHTYQHRLTEILKCESLPGVSRLQLAWKGEA